MKTTLTKFAVLALLATGSVLSVYLFFRHLELAGQTAAGEADFCSLVFGKGCDAALNSRFSLWLGLPLAGWGLVYYAMLAALFFLAGFLGGRFWKAAMTASLGLSLTGGAASLGMLILMSFRPDLFCPLCVAIHLINLSLILPIKKLAGQSWSGLFAGLADSLRFLFTGRSADAVAARWSTVAFLLVVFIGLAFFQWGKLVILQSEGQVEFSFNPEKIIADFEAAPEIAVNVNENDPIVGPESATVQLIIFSDFQCPACQHLSEWIPLLNERFGDQLQILFKHYPLSPACNPGAAVEIHPQACAAARAAEAASMQGAFWPYHDALFRVNWQQEGEEVLVNIARELRLDLQQFERDLASEAVKRQLQADIGEGLRLELDATPTVFLNGRRIYDLRPEALRTLIGHALYRGAGAAHPK